MKIRKANINDFKELYEILNKSPELGGGIEEETYSLNWVKGAITDKDKELVLIAEEDKQIVGLLMAELSKSKKYSYWIDFFVKKEFRKKGVAKSLMKEYYLICKKLGLERIHCLTQLENKRMQKIFSKWDFNQGNKFYFYCKKLK